MTKVDTNVKVIERLMVPPKLILLKSVVIIRCAPSPPHHPLPLTSDRARLEAMYRQNRDEPMEISHVKSYQPCQVLLIVHEGAVVDVFVW